jgi:hypothetical protein
MASPSRLATSTIAVAIIDANCGGVSRSGAIERTESRYLISIDGGRIAQAGTLESAAQRLATALRANVPRQDSQSWGLVARCSLRADVALAFGNQAGGGGGSGIGNQCVARIAAEYNRGANNLERALEFAARLIASCCST